MHLSKHNNIKLVAFCIHKSNTTLCRGSGKGKRQLQAGAVIHLQTP